MFEEMVLYHNILVWFLVIILLIGGSIPFWSSDVSKSIKRMRIYMFWFHAIVTAVAFSGLVTFIFGKIDWNISIIAMIIVYVLLSLLESLKYIKILKLSKREQNPIKKIESISILYTLINILLVLTLIIWKIKEHSNAVSLS